MRVGVAAIARPTFDVPFAAATASRAFAVLEQLDGVDCVGSAALVLGDDDLAKAKNALDGGPLDVLVVLQASFADSTLVAALAALTDAPILLWAFPEQRTGGRLRLNSLCGINLAAYVLQLEGRDVRHVYVDPDAPHAAESLIERLASAPLPPRPPAQSTPPTEHDSAIADAAAHRLETARIGIIGDRPTGFEPCGYDAAELLAKAGVTAKAIPLATLFVRAAAAPAHEAAEVRGHYARQLPDLDEVDGDALDRSIRLHLGLRDLVRTEKLDAVATRCWPECFTEFGGAACAPQSLLNSQLGVPGLCEADAYGAVTSLILQELVHEPVFVADLVDLDATDNTGVLWHCGLAPIEMADPDVPAHATIHSNRRLPLLYEFPLKAGRITLARLSQSRGTHRLVIGGAEMMAAPLAFSGTAGVARL